MLRFCRYQPSLAERKWVPYGINAMVMGSSEQFSSRVCLFLEVSNNIGSNCNPILSNWLFWFCSIQSSKQNFNDFFPFKYLSNQAIHCHREHKGSANNIYYEPYFAQMKTGFHNCTRYLQDSYFMDSGWLISAYAYLRTRHAHKYHYNVNPI